jgi:hypothetical protein
MALTMTRNRTQTTLVKLATRVANAHGELAFIEARLAEVTGAGANERGAATAEALMRRRGELLVSRDALYVTLRQFDPELDPALIGAVSDWLKPFGRGKAASRRWEASLLTL